MHPRRSFAATAIACLIAGSVAADELACGSFALYPEPGTIVVIDDGEDGPTAGDRRVGRYGLNDAEGRRVAEFGFVATVLPAAEDGTVALHATGVHVFAHGTVAIAMQYALPVPGRAESPQDERLQIVTGGTGAFERATGITTAVTLDDGRRRMTFDLHCP